MKSRGLDTESLHAGWVARTRSLGFEPTDVIERHEQIAGRETMDRSTSHLMIDVAIAATSEKLASWRPTEILRELAALTTTDTALPAAQLVTGLNKLTDHVDDKYCIGVSKPFETDALRRKDCLPVSESIVNSPTKASTSLRP